jgi:hypothetical protein
VRTDLEKALKGAPHALGVTEAAVKRRIRMGFSFYFPTVDMNRNRY